MVHEERLRKTLFWGYSRASVNELIQEMNHERERLNDTLKHKEEIIADMKEQVTRYQSKELLVSEVIIEAKDLAKNIIKDAHKEASDIRSSTEKEIAERLSEFELSMAELEAIKREIVTQETVLKSELKGVLQKHLEVLDDADLSTFVDVSQEIDMSLDLTQNVKKHIQDSEKVVQEDTNKKIIDLISKSKQLIAEVDDIPTYNFEQLF
ncbi:hypothetical protein GGG87_07175 [Streptococcus sp. zg-86]|uniref:DivIVA protein n=1 Tax=Streptococcus zhangguiae TaxID=2664091 RepID=A0ABW9R3Y3_9STRE|nr:MULTISPECIES: DivIVA domain-containing protein [unclassified Streptococcus]MTB64774.1 hypothetical protein [Streptococcus sp. zg-86]MTB91431.1 hypothetical protein [Streptococcus sp. zg-36]